VDDPAAVCAASIARARGRTDGRVNPLHDHYGTGYRTGYNLTAYPRAATIARLTEQYTTRNRDALSDPRVEYRESEFRRGLIAGAEAWKKHSDERLAVPRKENIRRYGLFDPAGKMIRSSTSKNELQRYMRVWKLRGHKIDRISYYADEPAAGNPRTFTGREYKDRFRIVRRSPGGSLVVLASDLHSEAAATERARELRDEGIAGPYVLQYLDATIPISAVWKDRYNPSIQARIDRLDEWLRKELAKLNRISWSSSWGKRHEAIYAEYDRKRAAIEKHRARLHEREPGSGLLAGVGGEFVNPKGYGAKDLFGVAKTALVASHPGLLVLGNPKSLDVGIDLFPDRSLTGSTRRISAGTPVEVLERGRGGRRLLVEADYYGTPYYGWVDKEYVVKNPTWSGRPMTQAERDAAYEQEDREREAAEKHSEWVRAREAEMLKRGSRNPGYQSAEIWSPSRRYVVRLGSNDGTKWDAHLYGDFGEQYLSRLARGVTEKTARAKAAKALASRNPGWEFGSDQISPSKMQRLNDRIEKLEQAETAARSPTAKLKIRQKIRKLTEGVSGEFRNPAVEDGEQAAADAYEDFHGRPAEQVDEFITYHTKPDYTAEIGELVSMWIRIPPGRVKGARLVELDNFAGARLTRHPTAIQLYIEDGDQSIDLAEFGLTGEPHETEYLGECVEVSYHTVKDHLGNEGGDAVYYHRFGKVERTGKKTEFPRVTYHVPDEHLEFAGGRYSIPKEGIDG
jgi:hypothetical protein